MQILHVLGKSYGGIRQHVAELDKELQKRGIESVLAGPAEVMIGLAEQEFVIPTPTPKKPLSILRSVKILRKASRNSDILHAHGVTAGYLLWFSQIGLPKSAGIKPIVLTTHNIAHRKVLGWTYYIVKPFQTFILKRATRIICPSQFAFDRLGLNKKMKEKTSIILPVSPIFDEEQKSKALSETESIRKDYSISLDDILLVCLARISPDKDLETLVDAVAIATKKVGSLKLLIAGRGSKRETEKLESCIAKKGIEKQVKLVGFVTSPEKLLGACDLAVLSSTCETVPLVLLESLQLGIPMLMTDVGVGPQVLDENCGQCVSVGDSKAFAEMIEPWSQRVASNTIDRSAIESRILDLVDREKCVQPLVDIYSQLSQN